MNIIETTKTMKTSKEVRFDKDIEVLCKSIKFFNMYYDALSTTISTSGEEFCETGRIAFSFKEQHHEELVVRRAWELAKTDITNLLKASGWKISDDEEWLVEDKKTSQDVSNGVTDVERFITPAGLKEKVENEIYVKAIKIFRMLYEAVESTITSRGNQLQETGRIKFNIKGLICSGATYIERMTYSTARKSLDASLEKAGWELVDDSYLVPLEN